MEIIETMAAQLAATCNAANIGGIRLTQLFGELEYKMLHMQHYSQRSVLATINNIVAEMERCGVSV